MKSVSFINDIYQHATEWITKNKMRLIISVPIRMCFPMLCASQFYSELGLTMFLFLSIMCMTIPVWFMLIDSMIAIILFGVYGEIHPIMCIWIIFVLGILSLFYIHEKSKIDMMG